jgi:hypothetical protein
MFYVLRSMMLNSSYAVENNPSRNLLGGLNRAHILSTDPPPYPTPYYKQSIQETLPRRIESLYPTCI